MSIFKQQGMAVWLLLLLFGAMVAASAVGGWYALMYLDRQATQNLAKIQPPLPPPAEPAPRPGETRLAEPPAEQPQALAAEADAPPSERSTVTGIDLTLKGVITRSDPGRSRALIAKGNKGEQAYHTGDAILDNVILEEVADDHVVLAINGRYETLYLNRTLQGSGDAHLPSGEVVDIPADDVEDAMELQEDDEAQ